MRVVKLKDKIYSSNKISWDYGIIIEDDNEEALIELADGTKLWEYWDNIEEVEEEWKPIPDYEHYRASSFGRFENENGLILKLNIVKKGYCHVTLYNENGIPKTFKSHRITAQLFVPNPENKPEVNHIKPIKTYNFFWNLEWNTRLENQTHAYKNNLFPSQKGDKSYWYGRDRSEHPRAKLVLDLRTGIFYDCGKDACEAKGICYSNLKNKLSGRKKNNLDLIYI